MVSSSVHVVDASSAKAVPLIGLAHSGVIIMAVAGVLSCILVSTLLISISYTALSYRFRKTTGAPPPFISKQIAVFVVCLLISDLIQSIAGISQIRWAAQHRLYEGSACEIQAATLVMGDLGSTVWSSVIAAHTFCGLALGKQWSRRIVYVIVVLGWALVIILTLIGPLAIAREETGPFFSIAGTWCFISSEYAISRLLLHYVPLFLASGLIVVLYGLVFLVLRGTFSFTGNVPHTSSPRLNDLLNRQRIIIAKRMLWYPIAYLTAIMPIAVIRIIGLKEAEVPESAWIFGMFFLFSLGAVDAIIYATTRQVVKPLHVRGLSTSRGTNSNTLSTPGNSPQKACFFPSSMNHSPPCYGISCPPCSIDRDVESGLSAIPSSPSESVSYFPQVVSLNTTNGSVVSLASMGGIRVTVEKTRN